MSEFRYVWALSDDVFNCHSTLSFMEPRIQKVESLPNHGTLLSCSIEYIWMVSGHHDVQQLASSFPFRKENAFCLWSIVVNANELWLEDIIAPEICCLYGSLVLFQAWFIAFKFSRRIYRAFFGLSFLVYMVIQPLICFCFSWYLFLICPWMQV